MVVTLTVVVMGLVMVVEMTGVVITLLVIVVVGGLGDDGAQGDGHSSHSVCSKPGHRRC